MPECLRALGRPRAVHSGLGQKGQGGPDAAAGGADRSSRGVHGSTSAGAAARQERDLAELLQDYGMDLGDTQHFKMQKLQELDALEVGRHVVCMGMSG